MAARDGICDSLGVLSFIFMNSLADVSEKCTVTKIGPFHRRYSFISHECAKMDGNQRESVGHTMSHHCFPFMVTQA